MKENPLEVAEIEAIIARDSHGSGRDLGSQLEPVLAPLGLVRQGNAFVANPDDLIGRMNFESACG